MIIDTTETKPEQRMNDVVSKYTCTTHGFEFDPDPNARAWRHFLCGFGAGLCNNGEEPFGEKDSDRLEWTKGYEHGKKARLKAHDEVGELLVDGKYIGESK